MSRPAPPGGSGPSGEHGGRPLRIEHVITTLGLGGAEILLERLVRAMDPTRITSGVVGLGPAGDVGDRLAAAGVPVATLGLQRPWDLPRGLVALRRHLRHRRPDVVHTWMYHADLLGGLAARGSGTPVIWSVHQTDLPAGVMPRATRGIARVNSVLSRRLPRRVVFTSTTARHAHELAGYPAHASVTIRSASPPSPPVDDTAVRRLRAELDLPTQAVVAVRIGRHHAQKDLPTLLRALAAASLRDLHLVCAGPGVVDHELESVLSELGSARSRVHLLGPRHDVATLHAAADLAISSSAFGETAPLVISEAMQSGLPVLTTDVGDSALMVGASGWVVPPRDVPAMARALQDAVHAGPEGRARRGRWARARAETELSFPAMVHAYEDLYTEVAGEVRR